MFPLIILAGPTASGKSEAAVALAEHLDTEVISADSLQVYKYFDIGTAKPSLEARQRVVHHLVDILEPDVEFTAFDFKVRALACARELARKGKIPILVGGTGLYLKVLTQDFDCAVQVTPEIRGRVKAEIQQRGAEAMYAQLAGIDADYASRISSTDPLRIERALAVYYQTGQRFSEFHASEVPVEREFSAHYYIFNKDRKQLYADIDQRTDTMMQRGLLDEVKQLLDRGFPKNLKPFQSIGYAQMLDHIDGSISLDRAVYEIKRDTRHYANRQITWFKKVPGTYSISVEQGDAPQTLRDRILSLLPAGVMALVCAMLLFTPGVSVSAGTYDDGLAFFEKKDYTKALNHFQVIRRGLPGSNESKQVLYLIGQTYMSMQDHKNAVETFKASLAEYPEIEDYILMDLARSWFNAGEYTHALEEVSRLLEKFPLSRLIPQAEMFRADVLSQLAKNQTAVSFLKKAFEKYSKKPRVPDFAPYLPELTSKLAVLLETERQSKEAYSFYRELFINYPSHPLTTKADPSLKLLGIYPPALSEEEFSARVQALQSEAHFQQVVDEISRYKAHEKGRLSPRFYFYLAGACQGLRQRSQANEALLSYLKEFPRHARVNEANLMVARNYWNLGQNEESIRFFQKVSAADLEWYVKAQYYLGRLYEDAKQYDLARKNFAQLAAMPTNHEYKETAAWRLAWTYYKAGDYAQSFEKFKGNIDQTPDGKLTDNNMFWMGKSAKKLAKDDVARQVFTDIHNNYPYSYYGLRAREILLEQNKEGQAALGPVLSKKDVAELPIQLSAEERFHYVRAREMVEMNLGDNARLELRQVEKTAPKNLSTILWLSTLYNRAGIYSESFRLLTPFKDLMGGKKEKELPVRFWKSLYPPAYAESIRFSSRNHHVDPFLVRGVIHQESMFDTRALSRAGARGLMQLMPETGRRLALSLAEQKPFVPDLLFDPEVNIKLGVRYLSELLKNTGNNPAHVLISYNAGPDVLKKWLQQFQDLADEDEFLESIPYQETRLYVRRVLRNLGIYRVLYPDGAEDRVRNDPF
jgi:tRNA dimethylallyltransferase